MRLAPWNMIFLVFIISKMCLYNDTILIFFKVKPFFFRLRVRNLPSLIYWPLANVAVFLDIWFSNSSYKLNSCAILVKRLLGEYHKTSLMINQHYPNQCWHSSMSSYGVNIPQRVDVLLSHPMDWSERTCACALVPKGLYYHSDLTL